MTQEISWPKAALVAAIIIVIATAGAFVLLRRGGGNAAGKENARIDYEFRFTYLGSKENVPLENLRLDWSAPKVDNSLPAILGGVGLFDLWYIEDDNTLTLEGLYYVTLPLQVHLSDTVTFNPRGSRSSHPQIYGFGSGEGMYGPTCSATLDRLYPREVFVMWGYEIVSKENADKTTLKVYGETGSIALWYPFGQENQRINFSWWSGLWRDNVLVEQFQGTLENSTYGWAWLWPVPIT